MTRKPPKPETLPSSPVQQRINFTRAEQLNALRVMDLTKVAQLKTKDGSRVRVQTLRLVLRCLDDHASKNGKAYPSYNTISLESDCKPRQAKRAIEILAAASLVMKRPRSRVIGGRRVTVNHYDIVWSEVTLLARARPESSAVQTALGSQGESSAVARESSAVARESSAVARESSAVATALKPPRTNRQERTASPNPLNSEPWEAAAAELVKFGIAAAAPLVRQARAAGEDGGAFLVRVRAAIETAAINARKFDKPPGAVYTFLRDGAWPADGVITIDEDRERQAARQREADEIATAEARRIAAANSQAIADEELETEWGPTLDAMPRAELLAFARDALPDFSFGLFKDRLKRDGKPSAILRLQLLEHLRAGRGAFTPVEPSSGACQ